MSSRSTPAPHRIAATAASVYHVAPWRDLVDEEIVSAVERDAPRAVLESLIGRARERTQGRGDNRSMALLRLDRAIPA